MKKTQFIDLISTIKKTAVSFIAITVFIALGLAFYGGTIWCTTHTEESLTKTYSDASARSLLVTDSLGVTQSQISELKNIDGVDDAEGLNIVYRFFENNNGERQQAAVLSLTENIDKLLNVEGELPTSAGQVAVLRSWAEKNDVKLGDVIELQDENASDYRNLQSVRSISQWDGEDIDDLSISTDDPGYLAEKKLTVTAIVDSAVYLCTNPYSHGICPANGLYVDAPLFVSEEEMPLEAFGGYTSIAIYSEKLNEMSSFSEEYKTLSEELSKEVQEVFDKWDGQLVSDFSESVATLRQKLDGLTSQTGEPIAEGESLYELLSQLEQELKSQDSFTGVAETDSNNSFLMADNLVVVLDKLRSVLGTTFLAIGVLICYSVISRLVAGGVVQIGTRKALGFYRWELIRFYLSYVSVALFIGVVLGILLGIFVIEFGLTKVLAALFTFTDLPLIFNPLDILPVFLIVCAVIIISTVIAYYAETQKSVTELLHGAFKNTRAYYFVQNSRLLQRLSLLNKTVLINLFRDKKRVFGMIIGIAGSAALMTAGLTFYFNFTNAFTKQFDSYYHFDYQICYDATSDSASKEIRQILENHNLDFAEVYNSCFIMQTPDGKTNAPNVIVPSNTEELAKIMTFDTDKEDGVNYDSGLWMSDYYCYSYDAEVGSVLTLQTLDGKEAEIPVDRYYKYHLSTPVIVMDADTYKESFGNEPASNSFYINLAGADLDELKNELEGVDGYIYIFDTYESYLASFSSEKTVVVAFAVLFVIMAILMGLMIVINLMEVYIAEKKNELIILMINGYERKFAKRYIYQDTIVLTVIGIIISVFVGSLLGDRALFAIEGSSIRMIHGISLISCAISASFTALLTYIVSKWTMRKVDKFRLSDIDTWK